MRGGAAGIELVVGGGGAGDAGTAWPAGRDAGEVGAGEGRMRRHLMPLELEMKSKRQQEKHLRRSPDPAEKRGHGQH